MQVKHLYPVGDIKEHVISPYCWCCPSVRQYQAIQIPGRPTRYETRIIHRAADGREYMDGHWECALAGTTD